MLRNEKLARAISCDWKNESLTLKEREWTCKNCGSVHDRDLNAAKNLKRLATINALPVASQSVTNGTEVRIISTSGGKVTPVRYECGLKDASGQEKNRDHFLNSRNLCFASRLHHPGRRRGDYFLWYYEFKMKK